MEPTKEALEAARDYVGDGMEYSAPDEMAVGIAFLLDRYNRPLRAEVEALRARVAELETKESGTFSKEIEAAERRIEIRRKRLTGRWI